MGCNVQIHEKTDKQGTWAFHSVGGWYLYTSPEHYRTHVCHVKDTQAERLSDTIKFKSTLLHSMNHLTLSNKFFYDDTTPR